MAAKKDDLVEVEVDPRVDKRRVTCTSADVVGVDEIGAPITRTAQAITYVRPDHLEPFVALMKRNGWQSVVVSDEPDAGPGGYNGATHVPADLGTPDAGTVYPATEV